MSATEQKHTPGPWRVDDIGANCLFIKGGVHVESGASASEREYYRNLATITQRDPHPRLDGGIHRKVTMANARLIAAAPELLEALRDTLALLEAYCGDAEPCTRDQARAAIAKATGATHE